MEFVAEREAAVKQAPSPPPPPTLVIPPAPPTDVTPPIPGLEQTVPVTGIEVVAEGVGVSVGNPTGVKQATFDLGEPASPVTPPPFPIDLDHPFPVDGRVLRAYLRVGRKYATWAQDRIERFGLKEGVSYACREGRGAKGRPTKEYWFTIRAAGWITPDTSKRGRLVRRYLKSCDPSPPDVEEPPVVVPEAAPPAAPVVDVPAEPPVVEAEVVPPDDELIPFELESGQPFPVNARGLHEYLQLGSMFAHWIKDRIGKFQLIENKDFKIDLPNLANQSGKGGDRRSQDYWLTITAARYLSADVHSERGRRVIKYLVARDEQLTKVEQGTQLPDLSDSDVRLALLHETTGKLIVANSTIRALGNDLALAKDEVSAADKRVQEIEALNAELVASINAIEFPDDARQPPGSYRQQFDFPDLGNQISHGRDRRSKEYWLTITTARILSADVGSARAAIKNLVAHDDVAEQAPRRCRQVIPPEHAGPGWTRVQARRHNSGDGSVDTCSASHTASEETCSTR